MLKRKRFLVFHLPSQWAGLDDMPSQLEWAWLNQEKVNFFFLQEDRLANVFRRFLTMGFSGLVWHNGEEWASYAWISLPTTFGPPHLSQRIRRLPVYWIFYCRTKDKYQGQGLFKASLNLLARWAREREPEAEVYIDTEPNNVISRRAIEVVGFLPKGVITTWTLAVPKFSLVIGGRWDVNAPHTEEGR